MMSSVGYSQVSDHANTNGLPGGPGGMPFPPRGGQPLPGMTSLPPPPSQQQVVNNIPGNTDTVIFKPEGRGASHIAGKSFEFVILEPEICTIEFFKFTPSYALA